MTENTAAYEKPAGTAPSVDDLVGIDPDWTGDMTTDEYVQHQRCPDQDKPMNGWPTDYVLEGLNGTPSSARSAGDPVTIFGVWEGEWEADLACLHADLASATACAADPERHSGRYVEVHEHRVETVAEHDGS